MRNYIFLFILVVFTSCKTTKEDYSKYTFIDLGIKSEKYKIVTLMNEDNELTNAYGYYIPLGRVGDENSDSEKIKRIMAMPFLLFNKSNLIYFTIDSKKKKENYLIEYNIKQDKMDTLKRITLKDDNFHDWINSLEQFYKQQKPSFIDFKFPEAVNYYKVVNEDYHSEISEEEIKQALEQYKDYSEEIKQDVIKTRSLRYNTIYADLQMPEEKIQFKFNSNVKKKIEFFGNEELYKKGYIYIYNNLNMFSHSSGLYVIRPKEKY